MMNNESGAKPVVDDKAWQEVIVVSSMADLFGNHLGLPMPQARFGEPVAVYVTIELTFTLR